MQSVSKFLACAAFLLMVPAAAHGASLLFTATLSGPAESPANASPGTGFATILIDPAAHVLTIDLSFTGLTSGTTASHIHAPTLSPFTGTAGVATTTPTFAGFPLGVTSGAFHTTLDTSVSSTYNPAFVTANGSSVPASEAALFSAIMSGQSYLNIHTSNFPTGEIRGFLTPAVPLPPAALSGGLALGSALLLKIRRRKA